MDEYKIDRNAFTAARAILEDFPELYAGRDKAVVAFKLFVSIKAGMRVLLREIDLVHARRPPSGN